MRGADGATLNNVATLPYSGKGTFSYIDNLPQSAASVIYTYVLQAPDVCATRYKSSKPASSMRLQASEASATTNNLQWNAYEGWNAVGGYDIYRSNGSNSTLAELLGSSASTLFSDNEADMVVGGYNITYNVIAIESGYGEDGQQATASSSYASIRKETLCWIPNAFTPKGATNNVFKPQISFIKEGSYRMKIYNRYGQILFETNDLSAGWDGTYAGHYVNPASYIYLIEFENSKGERQTEKGVFVFVD
jgi:gliding motility-associated-like protein